MQTYITTQNVLSRKQQRIHKARHGELPTLVLHIPIHPVLLNFNLFGFDDLTAVTMKGTIFWDVTPCSLVEVHRHFREKLYLQLQGWRVGKASNQEEAGSKQRGICFVIKILISRFCMHLHTFFPHAM
jgi:hypothetical protein